MNSLPKTPSFDLAGRRALVTGASRGIGLGAAAALCEAGAHVVLAARNAQTLGSAVEQLQGEGGSCEARVLDVCDHGAVERALETEECFDILVNNAGINRPGPFEQMTETDFDAVMAVNVRAAFFLTKAVVKRMRVEQRGGSIINVSSQMGLVGGLDRTVYCASKHAIEGFTRALAIEAGPDSIRVNTICPTFIRTPLTESTFSDPERRAWMESKIKLNRVGEIEDIMGAVVFLASDAAALITGSSLVIDGGWTAG
ncbi:MAG: glucose 1-dehydrogenase [Pseudomonadota bacterium]